MPVLAENKKAFFNYTILEKFEAGVVLNGQEVKSLRTHGVNLAGSYAVLKDEELFWIGARISPYQPRNVGSSYDPERSRKLLLKKSEIKYLIGKTKQKGLTLMPLKVYTVRGKIKLELAIVKGKKQFDKRESIKKRNVEREIEREMKSK